MDDVSKKPESKGKPGNPSWVKGVSGCPEKMFKKGNTVRGGRPKGVDLKTVLRKALEQGDVAEEFMQAAIEHAMRGNSPYFKEIMARMCNDNENMAHVQIILTAERPELVTRESIAGNGNGQALTHDAD